MGAGPRILRAGEADPGRPDGGGHRRAARAALETLNDRTRVAVRAPPVPARPARTRKGRRARDGNGAAASGAARQTPGATQVRATGARIGRAAMDASERSSTSAGAAPEAAPRTKW